MQIFQTVVDWHAEFRVSNKFKFPYEKKKKSDALLLNGKKTTGYPNLLEGILDYFRNKVIPNLLKLMK